MTHMFNRPFAGAMDFFRQWGKVALGVVILGNAGISAALAGNSKFTASPAPGATIPAQYTQRPVAQEQNWSGAYIGLHLGYAFGGHDRVALNPAGPGVIGTLRNNGPLAGLQAGYNWQADDFVFGLEGDLSFGNVKSSFTSGGGSAAMKIRSAASLRARGGITTDNDNLFYVTGGVGVARVDYQTVGGAADIDRRFIQFGYVAGAGWERALQDGISLRGEYLYSNFGGRNLSDAGLTTRATPDFHALRLGVNRRF